MTARLKPANRFVYVIGPESGLQKVGIATDPGSRLAALQTASPTQLMLHAAIAVPFGQAHAVERRAHDALAAWRASGEWFATTPSEAVDAVRRAAGGQSAAEPHEAAGLPLFAFQHRATPPAILPARARDPWLDRVRRTVGWA